MVVAKEEENDVCNFYKRREYTDCTYNQNLYSSILGGVPRLQV